MRGQLLAASKMMLLPGILGIKRSNNNHHHDDNDHDSARVEIIIRNPIIRISCFATPSPDHRCCFTLLSTLAVALLSLIAIPVEGQRLPSLLRLQPVSGSTVAPVQAFSCSSSHPGSEEEVVTGSPGKQQPQQPQPPASHRIAGAEAAVSLLVFPGSSSLSFINNNSWMRDRFHPDTLSCSSDQDHDNVTATPYTGTTDVMVMATHVTKDEEERRKKRDRGSGIMSRRQQTRFRRQVMNLAPLTPALLSSSHDPQDLRSLDLSHEQHDQQDGRFMPHMRPRERPPRPRLQQRGPAYHRFGYNSVRQRNIHAGTTTSNSRGHHDANYISNRRLGVRGGGMLPLLPPPALQDRPGFGQWFASSPSSSSSASSFRRERGGGGGSGWRNRFTSFP